ncbi:hypothetical protein [Kibdelosporangium phytohabitans]|uniref:hypothetical protein n=1 Tax=Kibdelosporangium phytohabitans TaxID=860235 RepID=UPI0012FC2997|nr:hypothetical protein [Kibdelosporangium phytohabitans]MBE1461679.1 hypothetical protein [Kibdelosporangium phytohabitans]
MHSVLTNAVRHRNLAFTEPLCLESISAFFGVAHRIVRSRDSALRPEALDPGLRAMAQLAAMGDAWLTDPLRSADPGHLPPVRARHRSRSCPRRTSEYVLVLFAAANRDPDQSAEPERFVADRRPGPQLGFGWGVHACVGGLFAKAMMRATGIGPARYPDFRKAGSVEFREQATVRAVARLPVSPRPR